MTLGDLALENDEAASAARAYWEATRRDPNDSTAWSRLAQTIRLLKGRGSDLANEVSDTQLASIDQRIKDLLELRKRYYDFIADNKVSQRYATRVAESLITLGRNWEAEAWTAVATTLKVDPSKQLSLAA